MAFLRWLRPALLVAGSTLLGPVLAGSPSGQEPPHTPAGGKPPAKDPIADRIPALRDIDKHLEAWASPGGPVRIAIALRDGKVTVLRALGQEQAPGQEPRRASLKSALVLPKGGHRLGAGLEQHLRRQTDGQQRPGQDPPGTEASGQLDPLRAAEMKASRIGPEGQLHTSALDLLKLEAWLTGIQGRPAERPASAAELAAAAHLVAGTEARAWRGVRLQLTRGRSKQGVNLTVRVPELDTCLRLVSCAPGDGPQLEGLALEVLGTLLAQDLEPATTTPKQAGGSAR